MLPWQTNTHYNCFFYNHPEIRLNKLHFPQANQKILISFMYSLIIFLLTVQNG